jgi:hypothetical protein
MDRVRISYFLWTELTNLLGVGEHKAVNVGGGSRLLAKK